MVPLILGNPLWNPDVGELGESGVVDEDDLEEAQLDVLGFMVWGLRGM